MAHTPIGPVRAPSPGPRLVGVDAARGLAIVGMFIAHLGTGHHPSGEGWGTEWMWLFDGRSSALFATLAGVGLALTTRRGLADAGAMRLAHRAIWVRAAVIAAIGAGLILLNTPIAIILPAYALLFVMAMPALRWPPAALVAGSATAFTLGSIAVLAIRHATTDSVRPPGRPLSFELVVFGYYPALSWIGFVLAGLAAGRIGLAGARAAAGLLAAGSVLAAAGYGAGAILQRSVNPDVESWPGVLVSTEPHSGSPFELAGNTGVALAVVGACLLAARSRAGALALALAPLTAIGAMSLTIYTAQILVIALLGRDAVYYPASNAPLIALTAGSMAFALCWRAAFGRGPLERLLRSATELVTASESGRRPDDDAPAGPSAPTAPSGTPLPPTWPPR